MEVDELAAGDPTSPEDTKQSKNPLEKMRVRLAAENYNKPNSYQTMPDDSDDELTAGLLCYVFDYLSTSCHGSM